MFPLSRHFLKCAAAGVALSAATTPICADETVQKNLRPHEPILTTIGANRVIAFYVPGSGNCNVQAVIWNADDAEATSAAGIRISLNPGQTAYIDRPQNNSLSLRCDGEAQVVAAVDATQLASQ